jgi:hypothetical protein
MGGYNEFPFCHLPSIMNTAVPSSSISHASNMNDKYNVSKRQAKYYDQVNYVLTTIQAHLNQVRQ